MSNRCSSKITFEDLKSLIKTPPGITDADIVRFTLQHQENTIRRSLKGLNRDLPTIRENWSESSPIRIYIAYELCNNNLEQLLLELGKPIFKKHIDAAVRARIQGGSTPVFGEEEEDILDEPENDKEDNDYVYTPSYESTYERKHHSEDEMPHKRKRRPKESTVPVDPSMPAPKGVSSQEWAHWSIAKRKSYIGGMNNPNAYYYRNVAPGEVYKTGPFTQEEKKLFLKRVEECRDKETGTINGEWGLFSRGLPGRVGYQCSNYYRKLVESGELHDPMYIKGEDGLIHHVSHLKSYRAKISGIDPKTLKNEKTTKHYKKEKKNKIYDPESICSLSFFSSKLAASTRDEERRESRRREETRESCSKKGLSLYDRFALSNPIPGWTDPITGEIMKVPAISPDYSLLDYNTWLHTIKSKPEDPFTQKPITKRQITVLSFDNWDQYKDRIIERYAELYAPKNFVNV